MIGVRLWRAPLGLFAAVLLAFVACVERVEVGTLASARAGSGGAAGAGGAPTAGAPGNGGTAAGRGGNAGAALCVPTACLGVEYDCGDCEDNDEDGRADAQDPECLGACDNSEDSYFGNIPGQNNAPCRHDCYFDADSGSENDSCQWDHGCDPLSLGPAYPPSGNENCAYAPTEAIPGNPDGCAELESEQSERCLDYCGPITPNGCDCFGCCELPAGSGRTVWLGSERDRRGSCSLAVLDDPESCRPCTPVAGCWNACDPCEDCAGRVGPGPECGSVAEQCAAGIDPCGRPGQASCPAGTYCVTGCCVVVPR